MTKGWGIPPHLVESSYESNLLEGSGVMDQNHFSNFLGAHRGSQRAF